MDDRHLGFLGPSSLIAGLLTLLITAAIWTTHGGGLFSPGPLNGQTGAPIQGVQSHAALGGKCSACHGNLLQPSVMDQRCEACHTNVTAQRDNPLTLHGNLLKNTGSLECRSCHQEHGGVLTDIKNARVDHPAFGYSLAGHATKTDGRGFACQDCHAHDFVAFDVSTCETCHLQRDPDFLPPHEQAFGTNCLACHDGKDSLASNFDHDQFAFPLEGEHSATSCYDCHTTAHSLADLQAAPTACNSCHSQDNPHSERLGTDCASCHTARDWQPSKPFDHNLAAYKLTGKHAEVACTDCHVNNDYKNIPTDCESCHKNDDAHKGQYTTNCALCHTEAGWKPAQPFDHNAFAFKLTGQHVNVPCTSCHTNTDYKNTPTDCESCHRNPHGSPYYDHCAYCHSTDYW